MENNRKEGRVNLIKTLLQSEMVVKILRLELEENLEYLLDKAII